MTSLKNQWTYFSDRPVGLPDDLLWEGEIIREQIQSIAERIVAPLEAKDTNLSDALTFAIYGKWGMGKSSALQMLCEQAAVLAKEKEVEGRLKFCRYEAPLHEPLAYNARTTMAIRMLAVLTGGQQEAVGNLFPDYMLVKRDKLEERLPEATGNLTYAPASRTSRELEVIATTLAQLVDYDQIIKGYLQGNSSNESPSQVLVVLVDDLDRCQADFVWDVLNAIQQLSNVPNIFFVLAVDQEQLLRIVSGRFEQAGNATNPDFALEKYVQHAVWVPDMDEERFKGYVERLMGTYKGDDLAARVVVENIRLLRYGIRVQTPRSIKRCLNTIHFDLRHKLEKLSESKEKTSKMGEAELEANEKLALKQRLLEYTWPDFYHTHLQPAIMREWGRERRIFTTIEAICREYSSTRDPNLMQFRLNQVAKMADNANLENLPTDLISYLGIPPFWFIERGQEDEKDSNTLYDYLFSGFSGPPSRSATSPRDYEGVDLEEEFMRLYMESEAAEAQGERARSLQAAQQICEMVVNNPARFGSSQAPMIGNIAINAEKFKETELATRLYHLALDLNPEHSNNLQNFVDFVVKAQVKSLYEEAARYVQKLKSGKHAEHKPDRTMVLEAQLQSLMGKQSEPFDGSSSGDEIAERLLENFRRDPANLENYVRTMAYLDQIGNYTAMHEVTKLFYGKATTDRSRYIAVRGLADMLAASPSASNERQAMDMYRHIRSSSLGKDKEAQDDDPDLLHNYATLLYKHDYDDEAGRLWFEAYRQKPMDNSIRRAYGMYLLRAGRADLAQQVSQGKKIDEEVLQSGSKEIPEYFTAEDEIERWWEQSS